MDIEEAETPIEPEASGDLELTEELAVADEEPNERPDTAATIVLQKKSIIGLMKEAAPDSRFTPDLQAAINRCCAVFLLYVSDGAQELAHENGKKTITPVEANAALIDAGFAEIAEEVRRSMKLENLALKKRKRPN